MEPAHARRRATALTASHQPPARPLSGTISGRLLKLVREQLCLTQERLAESLGVDKTTLQGWESGRRPLLAASSVQVGTGGAGWSPDWADDRSSAASLTRHGDRDPVRRFIAEGMGSDIGETANLNYWAYWLGLDRITQPDDTFMTGGPTQWDPVALLRLLADRLDPELGCIDLNIHSVWALIISRSGVLAADRSLNDRLFSDVVALLDTATVSDQSRRELEAVHYGLKLSRA